MLYYVGTKIFCHVNDDESLIFDVYFSDERYKDFTVKEFLIIGIFFSSYIILVDDKYNNTEFAVESDIDRYFIDPKYVGKKIFFIKEASVGGRVIVDPYKNALKCKKCNDWVPWAQPNQEDDTFICWVCRNTRNW